MPLSFLEDHGPGHADPSGEKPEKKKEDHRQQLIVGGTAVLIILAYLTYKSSKKGASASGTTVSSASIPGSTSGQVAGYGMDTDAYNGFTSYLQNIQGEVTDLGNKINTQANSTATLPATTAGPYTGLPSQDFSVNAVTGDINQDTAIAQSPFVSSLYQTYKGNPTATTQQQYIQGETQFTTARDTANKTTTTT